MILEAINNQAKLTALKNSIIKKSTIHNPKNKADALKDIPTASRNAIETLSDASMYISNLISLNTILERKLLDKDKMITKLSIQIGKVNVDNRRLKSENDNLIKGL